MKQIHLTGIASLSAAILLSVYLFSRHSTYLSDEPSSPDPEESAKTKTSLRPNQDGPQKARRQALGSLQQRWLLLANSTQREHDLEELTRLSVERLMCSVEMLELVQFIIDQGIDAGPKGKQITDRVADLFTSPLAEEARTLLVEAIKKNSPFLQSLLDHWTCVAASSCPPEEFREFYQELLDVRPLSAHSAAFARNLDNLSSDPERATRATFDELQMMLKTSPDNSGNAALSLHIEKIPPDANFEKIADLFADYPSLKTTTDYAAHKLFERWADKDGPAAMDYLVRHSDVCSPTLARTIASHSTLPFTDPHETEEWLKKIPADLQDQVLVGFAQALSQSGNHEAARLYASQIEDKSKRIDAYNDINLKEEGNADSEGVK